MDEQIEILGKWDNSTIALLYDNFYRSLVSYAMQFVVQEIAEDIVQEVFSVLWERRPVFASIPQLSSYLYNSTRNAALNQVRHQQVHQTYQQEMLKAIDENAQIEESVEIIHREEIYRQLFLAIEKLPPRQREIFLLAMKGKKNKEIAEQLSISAETVKVQKRRGLHSLKDSLSDVAYNFLFSLL